MDEFLDLPPEPPRLVDLHMGVAEVKTFRRDWWMETYGPKPPGPNIMLLNILIGITALANLILFFNVWKWIFE